MSQQGTRSSWLGGNRYDAALQAETARFAEAVHDADPGAAGAHLPGVDAGLTGLAHYQDYGIPDGDQAGRHFPELAALAGDGQTLHFCAADGGLGAAGEWLVRRGASGLAWERVRGPTNVTVRRRAADLLVVLTRRADPASRVEVAGDEPLFAHWLDHSRF
jgi:hypothetical protein